MATNAAAFHAELEGTPMPAVNRTKYHVVPRMSLMAKVCMIAAPAMGGYVLALLTILPWTLK